MRKMCQRMVEFWDDSPVCIHWAVFLLELSLLVLSTVEKSCISCFDIWIVIFFSFFALAEQLLKPEFLIYLDAEIETHEVRNTKYEIYRFLYLYWFNFSSWSILLWFKVQSMITLFFMQNKSVMEYVALMCTKYEALLHITTLYNKNTDLYDMSLRHR